MGLVYVEKVCKIDCFCVVFLNIGIEEIKGNDLIKKLFEFMKN